MDRREIRYWTTTTLPKDHETIFRLIEEFLYSIQDKLFHQNKFQDVTLLPNDVATYTFQI